jgi:segregation and condensation protein A
MGLALEPREKFFPRYTVQLEFFTGPLDLLLHLVHQREVSVAEVNMAEVCEQYLDIVSRSTVLDLDRATEYLVIAATLIALKSQNLLGLEAQPPEESFDPRFFEDLRQRLKVFELTKRRAAALGACSQLGLDTFARGRVDTSEQITELSGEADAADLTSAFLALLRRIGKSAERYFVRLEPLSIVSYMMKVVDGLASARRGSFLRFVRMFSPHAASHRGAVIATLIAVLELTRRGILSVSQGEGSSDFEFSLDATEPLELASEFDDKVIRLNDYRVVENERREASVG